MEGHVDADFEYDDWISDSQTWLDLADRCAVHQMYSLATDFYGLGILKDANAFKKPMLWYRFAKACMRCGRENDAHLSIVQALTTAPHNQQILRARQYWFQKELKSELYNFPKLLLMDMNSLLTMLPIDIPREEYIFTKVQSIVKGIVERFDLSVGCGARKDITRMMSAKCGVVIAGHPFILKARARWMGKISHLTAYDVRRNCTTKIHLTVPFVPIKEMGVPRKFKMLISTHTEMVTSPDDGSQNEATILVVNFIDAFSTAKTEKKYIYRRFRLTHTKVIEEAPDALVFSPCKKSPRKGTHIDESSLFEAVAEDETDEGDEEDEDVQIAIKNVRLLYTIH
jgi:hypothetical protein